MTAPLYIVELQDQRDQRLAGHSGCNYTSPPQPVDQALSLVRAFLGCPPETIDAAQQPWRVPVAGGQRTIHLHVADSDGQLTIDTPTTP